MNTILRPVLELTVMISGLFLAYLPVQTYLKQPPGRLAAWLAPLLAGICLLEGGFCYFLNIPTSSVLFQMCIRDSILPPLINSLFTAYVFSS